METDVIPGPPGYFAEFTFFQQEKNVVKIPDMGTAKREER